MSLKRYSELIRFTSFRERYDYLRLGSIVGESTFGFDRYLNQVFYRSKEWRSLRDKIIVRDEGNDLAVDGFPIVKGIIIHHMNPITEDDLNNRVEDILNPEFLVCVSLRTHNAIHFGDPSLLPELPITRSPGDTCPWK